MKTILIITAAFFTGALIFSSCKKDKNNGPTVTAISKIFENGKLITEFIYAGKKVIRENNYDEVTGMLDYAIAFEYDANGNMIIEKQYNKFNKLSGIVNYNREAGGKFIKHEYKSLSGADSGKVTVRVKYSYDLSGHISMQSWVDLVTDKAYTTRELKYYSNGNLKFSSVFYHYGVMPELQWKTEYSPAGDTMVQSLPTFKAYPTDFRLPDFSAGEQHSYQYDNGAIKKEINTLFSNRQYNSKGYITTQTATLKNILPLAPDKKKEIRYEYIEL